MMNNEYICPNIEDIEFLYIVQNQEYYKIGITKNIKSRISHWIEDALDVKYSEVESC